MGEAAAGRRRDRAGAGGSAAGMGRLRSARGRTGPRVPGGPRARPLAGSAAPGGNSRPGSCPRRAAGAGGLSSAPSPGRAASPGRCGAAEGRDGVPLAFGVPAGEIPFGAPARFLGDPLCVRGVGSPPRESGCGTREPPPGASRGAGEAGAGCPAPAGTRRWEGAPFGRSGADFPGERGARRGAASEAGGKFTASCGSV